MSFSTSKMWHAVMSLSRISHSVASEMQRNMGSNYLSLKSQGLAPQEPPQTVEIKPTIEATTGKLITTVA